MWSVYTEKLSTTLSVKVSGHYAPWKDDLTLGADGSVMPYWLSFTCSASSENKLTSLTCSHIEMNGKTLAYLRYLERISCPGNKHFLADSYGQRLKYFPKYPHLRTLSFHVSWIKTLISVFIGHRIFIFYFAKI